MRVSIACCLLATALLISSVTAATLPQGTNTGTYLAQGALSAPTGAFATPGSDQPTTVITDKLGNVYAFNKNVQGKDYAPNNPLLYPVSVWAGTAAAGTQVPGDNKWPVLKAAIDAIIPAGVSYTINGIGLSGDAYGGATNAILIGATQFSAGGAASGAIYRCTITTGTNASPAFSCAQQAFTGLSVVDPASVVTDSKGNMYTYSNTGHVALNSAAITSGTQKLFFAPFPGTPTGSFAFTASSGNSLFLQLISITVSPISDEVFVVDQGLFNQNVQSTLFRISTPVGNVVGSRQTIARFGTPSSGSWPVGVTVDSSNNVLVGHTNGKVYRFPANFPASLTTGVNSYFPYGFLTDFNCVYGVSYDALNNRLYIGDGGCDKTQSGNYVYAGIFQMDMITVKIFTAADNTAVTPTAINNVVANGVSAVNFVLTSPVATGGTDLWIVGVDYQGACTCYDPQDRHTDGTANPGTNKVTQRLELLHLCGSTQYPAVNFAIAGTAAAGNQFIPQTGKTSLLANTPAQTFSWTPAATYLGVYTLCFEYQWGVGKTATAASAKFVPVRGVQVVVQQPLTLVASAEDAPTNMGFSATTPPLLSNQLLNAIYTVDVLTVNPATTDAFVTNGLAGTRCALSLALSAPTANAVTFTPANVVILAGTNTKVFTWQSAGVVAASVPWTVNTGGGANCVATVNGLSYNLYVLGPIAGGVTAAATSAGVVGTQATPASVRNPDQWNGPGVNPSIMFTPITTFVSTINPTLRLTIAPALTAGEISVVASEAGVTTQFAPQTAQKFTPTASTLTWTYTPVAGNFNPAWQFIMTVGGINIGPSAYTIFANADRTPVGVFGIKAGTLAVTAGSTATVNFQPWVSLSTAVSVNPPGDVAGQIILKPATPSGQFKIFLSAAATPTGNPGIVLSDGLTGLKAGKFSQTTIPLVAGPENYGTFTYTPGAYVGPVVFTYTLAGYQYYPTIAFTIFVQSTPTIVARYSQFDPAYTKWAADRLALATPTTMVPLNAASVPQLQTATPWMINMGGPVTSTVTITITSNSANGQVKGSTSATDTTTTTNIVTIQAPSQFGYFTYADNSAPGTTATLTFAMSGNDLSGATKFFVGAAGGNTITRAFEIHGILQPAPIPAGNVFVGQNYIVQFTAIPAIPTATTVKITAVDLEGTDERNQGQFTEISTANPVSFTNGAAYLREGIATIKLAYNLAATSLAGAGNKLALTEVPSLRFTIVGPYVFQPGPALAVFVDAAQVATTESHDAAAAKNNQWSWPQFTAALATGFASGNTKDDSSFHIGFFTLPAIKGTMTLTIPTLPPGTGTGFYLNGVSKASQLANPGAPATPITVTFAPALVAADTLQVGIKVNAGSIALTGTNVVGVVSINTGAFDDVITVNNGVAGGATDNAAITIAATTTTPVSSVTFTYYAAADTATAINAETLYFGLSTATTSYVLGSIITPPAPALPTFSAYAVATAGVLTNYVVPTVTLQGYCTLATNTVNPTLSNLLFNTISKPMDVVCFPAFDAATVYTIGCSNVGGCTVVSSTGTGTNFGVLTAPGGVPTSNTKLTINPGNTIATGTNANVVLTPTLVGGAPTASWAVVALPGIPVVGAITFVGPLITAPQVVGTTITGFTVALTPAPAAGTTLTIRDGATAGTFASTDATFVSGGVGSGYATFKVSSAAAISFTYTPTSPKRTAFTASASGYVLSGTPPAFDIASTVVWANSDKVTVSAGTQVSYTLKIANGASSVAGFTATITETVPAGGAAGKFNYLLNNVKTEIVGSTAALVFPAGASELQFFYTPNSIGSISLTPLLSGADITANLFPATIATPAAAAPLLAGALSLTVSGGVIVENIPTSLAINQKVTIKVTVSPLPAVALVVTFSDNGMGGSFSVPSLSFIAAGAVSQTVTYTAPSKIPADTGSITVPISGQKGISIGLSGGGTVSYLINPQTVTTTGLAVTDLIVPANFLNFKLRIAASPSVSGVVFNTVPSLAAAVGVKKTDFNALTATTSATVLGSLNAQNAAAPIQFNQPFVPGQLAPAGLTSYTATVPFDVSAVVVNVAFSYGTMIITDGSSGQQFALPTALTGFVTPIMYLAPGLNTFSVFNGPVPGKGDGLYTFAITRLSLHDVKLVCASNPTNHINYGGALKVGDTIPVPYFVAGPESAGGVWTAQIPYECETVGVIAVGVGAPVILTTLNGIVPKPSPLSLPLNFPSDKLGVAFGWADTGNVAAFTVGGGPDGLFYSFALNRNNKDTVEHNAPLFACAKTHYQLYAYPNTPLLSTLTLANGGTVNGGSLTITTVMSYGAAFGTTLTDERSGVAQNLVAPASLALAKSNQATGVPGYSVQATGFTTPAASEFPIKVVSTVTNSAADANTALGYTAGNALATTTTFIYYGQC
jgi:hypothetical protein